MSAQPASQSNDQEKARKSSLRTLAAVGALGKVTSPRHHEDILQFSTAGYYCCEGEKEVVLQVDRLGACETAASVEYFTVDASALAGRNYKASKGVLEFAPGETEKIIKIGLIDKDFFDSVLEFEVKLVNVKGARLGLYLHQCEVTVADDDFFPTNTCRNSMKLVHPWRLMTEYVKFHMQDSTFQRYFYFEVIVDMLENLQKPYSITLTTYLIDYILQPADGAEPPQNATAVVWGIVLLLIVPHPLLWLCDQGKADHRLPGKANMRLQQNLMRKFLNYNNTSRDLVSNSDLTMAITRDVPELVQNGLLVCVQVLQKLGLLVMLGGLAIWRSTDFPWMTVVLFFSFPVLITAFLRIRHHGTEVRRAKLFMEQTNTVAFVERVTSNFRLIADYFQTQETVMGFSVKVKNCNDAATRLRKYNITNEAFAPLLTDIFVGVYILINMPSVMDGAAIGAFVTGIEIWREIGQCYLTLYNSLLDIQQASAPLMNVVYYMNLPLDTPDRVEASKRLLEELDKAQEASQRLLYESVPSDCSLVQQSTDLHTGDIVEKALFAQDLIQIDCRDLCFTYAQATAHSHVNRIVKPVFQHANFEISQGQLAAIVGGPGSGKATLLELLAGVLVPERGSGGLLFVPPHLRILHVTFAPLLFSDLDILGNLLYGADEDEAPARALRIAELLGMSDDAMKNIDESLNCPQDGNAPSNAIKIKNQTDIVQEKLQSIIDGPTTVKQMLFDKAEDGSANRPAQDEDGAHDEEKGMEVVPQISRVMEGTAVSVARRENAEHEVDQMTLLSYTDKCLINIGRALVMNPEVMILHKPLAPFDCLQQAKVLELLRDFVDLRGIEKPILQREFRRPRTCIFSVATHEGLDRADLALKVLDGTIKEVDMDAVAASRKMVRRVFKQLDTDNDGQLSKEELVEALSKSADAAAVFNITDGTISRGPAAVQQRLMQIFDEIDSSGNGDISLDELITYAGSHMDIPTLDKTTGSDEVHVKPGRKNKWEDRDVPQEIPVPRPRAEDGFAGQWNRGTIANDLTKYISNQGSQYPIEVSGGKITLHMQGQTYTGTLHGDRIGWNDDDVWQRVDQDGPKQVAIGCD